MKKRKWLIYTVIIGLIPFLLRLLIFVVKRNVQTDYIINEVDMVTFGLVLHLTNINELENLDTIDRVWKTTWIGVSVVFLIVFSCLLGFAYLADLDNSASFDKANIKRCAVGLSIVSLVSSYFVQHHINKQS